MKTLKKLFFTIALALFVALGLAACGGKKGVNIFTDAPNRKATKINTSSVEVKYAYPELVDKTTDDENVTYANAYDNPKNDYSVTYTIKEKDKDTGEPKDVTTVVDPMKSAIGYAFNGWFKDEKLTQKASFPITLKKGDSLYAGYIKRKAEPYFTGLDKLYPTGDYQIRDLANINAFNPISGIGCTDEEGLTYNVTTNYDKQAVIDKGTGEYNFVIEGALEKEDHRGNKVLFKTSTTITLIIGERSDVQIEAPMAITYYKGIGDTLDETTIKAYVSAYNRVTGAEVNKEEITITGFPAGGVDSSLANELSLTVSHVMIKEGKPITSRATIKVHLKESVNLELPTFEQLKTKSQEKTIEIAFWHSNGDNISKAMERYADNTAYVKGDPSTGIKGFTERMKDLGVNVKITVTKNGNSYDELLKNFINASQGGSLPNIVQGYPDHFYEYNNAGSLQSLLPFIHNNEYGYGKEDGVEFEKQKGWNDIFPKYREEQMGSTPEGDILSVPFQKSTEVMIYNKTFFDFIGKTTVPETWEDLMETATLVKEKKNEYIDSLTMLTADERTKSKEVFMPYTYDSSANAFINLTKQNGGIYTTRVQNQNGKYSGRLNFVNNQPSKAALKKFGEWSLAGNISAASIHFSTQYSSDLFKKAQCVVTMSSSAGARKNLPYVNQAVVFEPGFAAVPYFKGGKKSVVQQGPSIAMIKDVKKDGSQRFSKEQTLVSWLFMKFLTSKEVQADFAIATGYQPVRASVHDIEAYQNFIALADLTLTSIAQDTSLNETQRKTKMEQVLQARSLKAAALTASYQSFDIPFIGSSSTRIEVGKIYDQVLTNKDAAQLDKIIDDAYRAADNALKSIVR